MAFLPENYRVRRYPTAGRTHRFAEKLLERIRPSTHDEPARNPVKRKLFRREFARLEGNQIVNRNVLYLVIGALAVVSAIFGYQLYQERQKSAGIEINVGKSGISIEKK